MFVKLQEYNEEEPSIIWDIDINTNFIVDIEDSCIHKHNGEKIDVKALFILHDSIKYITIESYNKLATILNFK